MVAMPFLELRVPPFIKCSRQLYRLGMVLDITPYAKGVLLLFKGVCCGKAVPF